MRIVFWGSERGCAATSNMLILATYLACQKGYRITMLEIAEEEHGILNYFPQKGGKYVKNYIRTLVERQLYYVPVDAWCEKNEEERIALIKYLETNMDMVFINLANRTDDEARNIMHNAHLLVMNLKQELRSFDRYYARYANLSTKILLLIGNYYYDKGYDKEYIQEKYRIPDGELVVIPNNPEYEMAWAGGKVERYIRRSRMPWRTMMKRQFLKDIEKAAEQLCRAAGNIRIGRR